MPGRVVVGAAVVGLLGGVVLLIWLKRRMPWLSARIRELFLGQFHKALPVTKGMQARPVERRQEVDNAVDRICILCDEQEIATQFLPCEHSQFCIRCTELYLKYERKCPECRNLVNGFNNR